MRCIPVVRMSILRTEFNARYTLQGVVENLAEPAGSDTSASGRQDHNRQRLQRAEGRWCGYMPRRISSCRVWCRSLIPSHFIVCLGAPTSAKVSRLLAAQPSSPPLSRSSRTLLPGAPSQTGVLGLAGEQTSHQAAWSSRYMSSTYCAERTSGLALKFFSVSWATRDSSASGMSSSRTRVGMPMVR